jgi:hypothetical protein
MFEIWGYDGGEDVDVGHNPENQRLNNSLQYSAWSIDCLASSVEDNSTGIDIHRADLSQVYLNISPIT